MRRTVILSRFLGLLGLLGLLLALAAPARADGTQGSAPSDTSAAAAGAKVDVVEVSGVLDRARLDTLTNGLARARSRGVDVVLVQVDSFGGLGVRGDEVARAVRDAGVPVAVWVGPRRARAAGAAAALVAAADVVAVDPTATVGPALPAELGRRGGDRSADGMDGLPAGALGAAAGPGQLGGVVDYQARSLPDAVRGLDGRDVRGRRLAVADAYTLTFQGSGLVERLRHGLANPTLAYLLLLGAACCLAFEWFQPGFGVAGIAGAVMALLAAYSLAVLPTNWLALAGLVAGLAVLTVDAAVGGLGPGTAIGGVLTGVGSWWLFASPSPLLRVDHRLAVLGTVWCLVYWVVVLTVVLRARRWVPEGGEALVGGHGTVRSTLNPGGIVVVDGAVWRADLAGGGKLDNGSRVRVTGVKAGVLQVEPVPVGVAAD